MPEKTQDLTIVPTPMPGNGVPEVPKAATSVEEEELAKQELARIMPSKEELHEFVVKSGPLPKWLDEDEGPPF